MKNVYLITVLLLFSNIAYAKLLYVNAASGSDSVSYLDNSQSNPWRTIGRAAWGSTDRNNPNTAEAAQAGDTVYVVEGIYSVDESQYGLGNVGVIYNPANSGQPNQYITFESQGRVELRFSSGMGPMIGAVDRSYVVWRGFYINENYAAPQSDTGPIVVRTSSHVIIDKNIVDGITATYGDNHNGIRIENSDNVVISNNRITGIKATGTSAHNGAGLMMYGNHDVVIENNEISDCGAGIYPKGNNNYNVTIRHNLVSNCRKGIRVTYSSPTQGQNYAYKNIIRDEPESDSVGIELGEFSHRWIVANNTIDNYTYGLSINSADGSADLVFKNNIISHCRMAINATRYPHAIPSFDDNNFYNCRDIGLYNSSTMGDLSSWRSATGQDLNSTTQLPGYHDESINNFRLTDATNTGQDILDLDNDSDTSDTVLKGAYPVGDEIIGFPQRIIVKPTNVQIHQ